jgi:hypothetical protein
MKQKKGNWMSYKVNIIIETDKEGRQPTMGDATKSDRIKN